MSFRRADIRRRAENSQYAGK